MELTLKDQSVVEIGQAVGNNVNSLAGGASTALVPAGGGGAVAPAGGIATAMNPFDSMMVVLSDIRDGIYSLVDKFSESVSIQQDAKSDAALAQDLSQVADTGEGASDEGTDPAPKQSFFSKAKDKVKGLLGAGGFKGMLIKGGLIFGLLGIAKLMQKYGKEIAEKVAPIVDGIKAFFSAFSDDIGPLFDKAVAMVKDAISGLLDIFKGLFTGDASTFLSGVKKIFIDFPIKLVSYIGDAFFSLIENALAAFGIESEMVTDIKLFFRQLPEKISELFTNIGKFFTETIPQKLEEIKTSITNFFNDNIVMPIKGLWTDIGNFFTVTVPEKFTEITTNVTSFFTNIVSSISGFFTDGFNFVTQTIPEKLGEITAGIAQKFVAIKDQIIDFAMAPFRKIRELFDNLVIGILESVEGIPLIGGKAKEMKEAILANRAEDNATTDTSFSSNFSESENRFYDDIEKKKDEIKKFVEASGYRFSLENTKSMYMTNQDSFVFKKPDGSSFLQMNTAAFNAKDTLDVIKENPNIQAFAPATGGATGAEMNNAGAEFVGAGNPTGGGNVNVINEGAKVNTVSSNATHMTEDTGSNDKSYRESLYDF